MPRRKQRELWRRRLLPGRRHPLGCSASGRRWSTCFKVPPFIAPSPVAVFATLDAKFGVLMENLLPTAIEAFCGFLLGNLAAIMHRHGVRAQARPWRKPSSRWWS